MKMRITPALQSEFEMAIEDAIRTKGCYPSDGVYLKIHAAMNASKGVKAVYIEADEIDVRELKNRAVYEVELDGVCDENIALSNNFTDRAYWLGRKRAYMALLKQIKAGGAT